jgi:formylglycine-generating enzyme required for sulfatase activity
MYNDESMAWGRLALLQAADDRQALDKLAEVFGYAKQPDRGTDGGMAVAGGAVHSILEATISTEDTAPKRPPARFLRVNKIIQAETDRDDRQKPGYLSDPDMRLQASVAPTGTYRFAAPPPLMPMARLLPLLFNGLAQAKSGQSIDHRLLLRRIEQGRALQRLPKQQRQRWPQRLQIIVDASHRLEPYWADFEFIVRQLQTLLGKEAVEALRFDDDTLGSEVCYCLSWPTRDQDQWQPWQAPPLDVAILILSDLGINDSRAAVGWQRRLAGLQQRADLLTLSPASCSPDGSPYCHPLRPNPYNDYYPMPRHPSCNGFAFSVVPEQRIKEILSWLSALPLIDAGLLRRLRIAMQWGDSALEAAIWNHPEVRDIGLGICLQQQAAEGYQQRFQQKFAGSDAAKDFWFTVEQHHKGAYQGLRQSEKFKQCLFEQLDDPAMFEYFQRLCATGMQSGNAPAQQRALRLQCRTVLASLPHVIWSSRLQELAYHLYAVAYEEDISAGRWPEQLESGFNPERLQWMVNTSARKEKPWWHIVQVGDQGQIKCEPCSLENAAFVITFRMEVSSVFSPRLTIMASGKALTRMLHHGLTVTLPENGKAVFESGELKLELDAICRPSWADRIWRDADGLWTSISWMDQDYDVFWQISKTEADGVWLLPAPFGEDAFGVYADLSVKKVTQRFRWIEPGSFWMGSPEDEPEREWSGQELAKDSETRHKVTLSQGFWLADTAVSQAFWQAVMGDNPSHFKNNPEHPVERVSWQDTQVFTDKLNSLFPGLSAKLPSEAQWEYACRAGTDTPFSFGANISPEQVNYNGKYPYAGVGKGLNRGQTVPVKSLPANPWGLYEMHGNVWDWCEDVWQRQLPAEPVTDPLITKVGGVTARVVRGGSWFDLDMNVRSAIRDWFSPAYCDSYLGFRLALGHAELRPGEAQELAIDGGTGRRVAEQRQTGSPSIAEGGVASNWLKHLTNPFSKKDKKKK